MSEADRTLQALRDAIADVAGERAPSLVAEARAEAESRVRARLTAVFEASMLERAAEALRPAERTARSPQEPESTSTRPSAVPKPGRPVRPKPEPSELGYYVYGVAWADGAALPDDLEGVDPANDPALIEHRGLAAIASRVSLDEFGEEPLHENLNDVDWLEEKARAHERVLDSVLSRMPVVPMRLCTIYRGETQVREALERDHDVFADALRRLEGKTEWGVKLIAEAGALERAADAEAGGPDDSGRELSTGAAYMREKGRVARRRDVIGRIAEAWAEAAHDHVAAHAEEALLNPLQNPEVSGHTGDMLLNGVYLVDDRAADVFHSAVDQLATEYDSRGVRVELTGPWPPYNFVKGSIEAAR